MARPKVVDDGRNGISVMLNGEELQSWHYSDEEDRREKRRYAWYFCDGFMCGRGATKISAEQIGK